MALSGLLVMAMLFSPTGAAAHCDSLDGPVVQAAIRSLETGRVDHVLIWVQPDDEPRIRDAFIRTLRVRDESPAARELADQWFFETVVRTHREGEGAPFTGLKPAGHQPAPGIAEADRAVESGSLSEMEESLIRSVRDQLRERFATLRRLASHAPDDLDAGRAWVAAYVEFIHFAEEIHAVLDHGPVALEPNA
ncbi:MAG TPA: DUF6448 family protein [Longimicrobiales bacterium]|nr:DUF6448 family protein [Longimicrobiales bacterium]